MRAGAAADLASNGTISGSATSFAGAAAAAALVTDSGTLDFETGSQGNSFAAMLNGAGVAGATGTFGIYSSRVASAASGFTSSSASNSKAEALATGTGAWGGCTGIVAVDDDCTVLDSASRAAGSDAAGIGLVASAFRSNPRATRSVPFDCSMLIGLVRTRLAPMRNALATPSCPSTTATERELELEAELRALLNSKVAFCSFSQSTTIASKCCAISFLTVANGSLQRST